ncbi:MAG: hypothetical protein DHS20C13_09840 [Thermodesulfobacteriota bacterium]|nr:MAG: hypothetical protein DHS20C13_09840 [Thermodesulfobacteriota bacterium]
MRIILASLILSVLYSGAALAQNVYIANQKSNTVSVISDNPTVTVVVGMSPSALAVTPDGDFVYVANGGNNNVSVIQTSDNTVVDTVVVDSLPFGIAVTPNGDFVYVSNAGSNTVSVIQTSNNTVIATVVVDQDPSGVAIPTDDHVFVANSGSDTVSVIQISNNTVVATVNVGSVPTGIAAGPNGDFVYVANNISNNVSIVPVGLAITNPAGPWVTVAVGESPVGIASSQNSTLNLDLIYVANQGSNTISIINHPFNEIEATLDVADSPTGIAATPDGDLIYVTHLNSAMAGVIEFGTTNPDGWSDESLFPTGDEPTSVAIAPSEGLGDPEPPMGGGNGSSSNSCGLAGPGATNGYSLMLLFIPAIILIRRFWRRRTN